MLLSTSFSPLAVLALASLAAGYLVSPPGTAAPGTNANCSSWVIAGPGVTCALVEQAYRVSEEDFEDWVSFLLPLREISSLFDQARLLIHLEPNHSGGGIFLLSY